MYDLILIACGWISDHWGRCPSFILGAALTGRWVFAFFPLLESRSTPLIFLAIAVELAFLSLMYGPQAALFAQLFPVDLRYSGASLAYQIGSVVSGGLAPIIAAALYAEFKASGAITAYLALTCLGSLLCAIPLRARRGEWTAEM